jgi:CheY-like chemotaxis protein/signal transduction histidine kinase
MRTEELLVQSQKLTTELQSQQLELQQTNEELEEKARLLSEQNQEVEKRTREIDEARHALEQKADQLALTSKYKSQFLANMSHELRTPLNSLLILSKKLSDNGDENLTSRQVEMAQTIRRAGADLLTLINDILDLSKIESGTTSIDIAEETLADICDDIERSFRGVAQERGLIYRVIRDHDLPEHLATDNTRLMQILKNLLSNAFKFTSDGAIDLRLYHADREIGGMTISCIAFAVSDTGIGIVGDKHNVIFEPFQQADMSTARKYGGTGLGLAISREIAGLLGGEMTLQSEVGVGSTFTFYHPVQCVSHIVDERMLPLPAYPKPTPSLPRELVPTVPQATIADDRDNISTRDRVAIIIEDDTAFAGILLGLLRDRGFKGLVAQNGADGLALARAFVPDAITLDIGLPDIDGFQLLEELKRDPSTRNIPVHVMSAGEHWQRALQGGAFAHLQKPATEESLTEAFDRLLGFSDNQRRNVLVVEDDVTQLSAMASLIGSGEVEVTAVSTGGEALEVAERRRFDCIIIDLGLPDMDGVSLLEQLKRLPGYMRIPVIVYTGRDLSPSDDGRLRKLSESVIVKDQYAPERLQQELSYFLNQVEARMPVNHPAATPRTPDISLKQCTVLIVDDDVRNIFALRTALEDFEMDVLAVESGMDCLKLLAERSDIDVVLMDIMMPDMDGYETIRRIRAQDRWRQLPIIALTAKAMKSDRESALAVGASEYVSKPVDIDRLVNLIRVWMNVSS